LLYQDIIGSLEWLDKVAERAKLSRIYSARSNLGFAPSDFASKAHMISACENRQATLGRYPTCNVYYEALSQKNRSYADDCNKARSF
jgi:hypothetical protein